VNHAWAVCDWLFRHEPWPGFASLRIPGVLQRIALVYLATSLLALHANVRTQIALALAILLGYWALLTWLPNPHDAARNLSPTGNIVRVVDRTLLSDRHLYTQGLEEPTDPEGLLSTFPAIITALLGYWAGIAIQRRGITARTAAILAAAGAIAFIGGLAWGLAFPISKKLWTSSFVLLTGGAAAAALAACLYLFDVRNFRRLAHPFEIVGVNAILLYVGSELVATLLATAAIRGQSLQGWLYKTAFTSWINNPTLASLAFAVAFTLCFWMVSWGLARRGWALRV
jgi:predicted acyltransferase